MSSPEAALKERELVKPRGCTKRERTCQAPETGRPCQDTKEREVVKAQRLQTRGSIAIGATTVVHTVYRFVLAIATRMADSPPVTVSPITHSLKIVFVFPNKETAVKHHFSMEEESAKVTVRNIPTIVEVKFVGLTCVPIGTTCVCESELNFSCTYLSTVTTSCPNFSEEPCSN